eukprot:2341888-Pyramimonas_sp.AAC.1
MAQVDVRREPLYAGLGRRMSVDLSLKASRQYPDILAAISGGSVTTCSSTRMPRMKSRLSNGAHRRALF